MRLGIKPRSGFVQYKHLRLHSKHSRYRYFSLLSARKFERRTRLQSLIFHTHKCERSVNSKSYFFLTKSQILGTEFYIEPYGFLKKLVLGILKHYAYSLSYISHRNIFFSNVDISYPNISRFRFEQSVHMLYQCRLTGTRMSDNANKFTVFDVYAHIVKRRRFKSQSLVVNMS